MFSQTYVSSVGNDTTGDGSLGSPYATLFKAITETTDGGTINIVGTITQTATEVNITSLSKDLTFQGQSNGKITGDDTNRMFNLGQAVTLVFEDLTFENFGSTVKGSVMFSSHASANITFRNCLFNSNTIANSNGGGALHMSNSTFTIEDSTFSGNSNTAGGGGAILITGSATATISGTTFYNNSATARAGAILALGTSNTTITNSTFFENKSSKTANYEGAAIRVNANGTTLSVTNCLFYNNKMSNGTGVYSDLTGNAPATMTFVNSLAQFVNNLDTNTNNTVTNSDFLSASSLTWNGTLNKVTYTAPLNLSDDTPIDFGNDTSDTGAWDSKINIFKGKTDGAVEAWTTASNWSNGGLPTSTDNVAILNGAACTLNGEATINNIKVTTRLDIKNDRVLIVNGDATIEGSGNVNYFRDLTDNTDLAKAWHLVSSPLSGEVFDDSFVSSNDIAINGSNNGIASYNTGQTGSFAWTYLQTGGTINATNGQGYSMKITPDGVTSPRPERADNLVAFEGNFNTDNSGVTTASLSTGFNLLGNPYTSFINSATFLGDNGNIDQTQIWVWDSAAEAYLVKIAGDTNFALAPAQGFFVEVTSSGTVNFTKSNQATTGSDFLKSSRTEVKLLMSDGTNNRFAKIYYTNTATKGFDFGWEGETFGGIPSNLDVYTHLVADNQGKKYQVQSLPDNEMENIVVPIGVKAEAGKQIAFATEIINLPSGLKVFLEDRVTNTFIRLDEVNTEYIVTLNTSLDGIGRFYLHTSSSALSINQNVTENINIYKTSTTNLRIVGLTQGNTNIKLYNILGKQVLNKTFKTNGVSDITLPKLTSGVYIVQLETENGKLNKKIILE